MEYLVNTSIPVVFETVENLPFIDTDRFQTVKVWIAHTGLNLNNSVFSKEVLESMIPSLSGIPILGYIQENSDGTTDFTGHEQRLVIKKGSIDIAYVGKAFGVVLPNNNAKFEMKTVNGEEREYLTCEGILWKKFKDCMEIFERDNDKSQSMELFPPSIKGTFSSDKHFHFQTAKFDGLCILGDEVAPAMVGGSVEKFAISTFSAEVTSLLEEIKNSMDTFASLNFNSTNIIEDNNEGGSKMDEKLMILEKYGHTVETIDFSIEDISVEELDEKMKEFATTAKVEDTVENTPADPDNTAFAMSHNSLWEEVNKAVSVYTEIIVDYWDGQARQVSSYFLVDIKDSIAIVRDRKWAAYGIPFTAHGDTVELNLEGKVEYVSDWRPKTETDSDGQSAFAKAIDEITADITGNVEKFNAKITELTETNTGLIAEKDAITAEFTALKDSVTELTEYKTNNENLLKNAQMDELFEKYSVLEGTEEFDELKTKRNEFSVEEMEMKVALCFARKNLNFTANTTKSTPVRISVATSNDNVVTPYGGLMERFLDK